MREYVRRLIKGHLWPGEEREGAWEQREEGSRQMRILTKSLRRTLMIYILAILAVLTLLLFSGTVWMVNNMRQEVLESGRHTLATYEKNVLEKLTIIDDFLMNTAGNDVNFMKLYQNQGELAAYEAGYELVEKFEYSMYNSYLDYGYCVISRENGLFRSKFTGYVDYGQQGRMREYIDSYMDENERYVNKNWFYARIGEKDYIVKTYGGQGNCIAALVNLESFGNSFFGIGQEEEYTTGLFLENGKSLARDVHRECEIQTFSDGSTGVERIGEWLILSRQIAGTDIWMGIIQGNALAVWNNIFLYYIILLTAFCLLLMPVTYCLLRRWIVTPVGNMLTTLQDIGGGDLEQRMDETNGFYEFRTISGAFNHMMQEIRDLKIASMQLEIDKQQAQLQYLQEQLRPHFFLNCLKNVYALAENRKYSLIQEIVAAISYHFRFVMEDSQKLVPLERELRHTENYVKLQNLLGKDSVNLTISMDAKMTHFRMPPLCIQACVENSSKYGRRMDRELCVKLVINSIVIEGEEYADITVQDNGPGFDKEVLDKVNNKDTELFTGQHVGIINLKNRLRLIYGHKAVAAFYNGEDGAVAELILPASNYEANEG